MRLSAADRTGPRFYRNPLVIFLLVSLLLVVGIFLATNAVVASAAEEAALSQAESVTESFVEATMPQNLRQGLLNGRPGSVDKFFRRLGQFDRGDIASFDILRADGLLAYDSLDPGAAGDEHYYSLTDDQQRILDTGGTASSVADPRFAAQR